MPQVQSFDPVIGSDPRVLILGSMPGVASLEARQYYAHPRNAFWPIMANLFGIDWADSYDEKIKQFKELPLVLWDVLKSCQRDGSLDSNIAQDQLEPNAIAELLFQHPSITLIVFNGAAAEKYFLQKVAKSIQELGRVELVRLPSTSPAHASKTRQQKFSEWAIIRAYLDGSQSNFM